MQMPKVPQQSQSLVGAVRRLRCCRKTMNFFPHHVRISKLCKHGNLSPSPLLSISTDIIIVIQKIHLIVKQV